MKVIGYKLSGPDNGTFKFREKSDLKPGPQGRGGLPYSFGGSYTQTSRPLTETSQSLDLKKNDKLDDGCSRLELDRQASPYPSLLSLRAA